jgi:DNA-binding CsgD family transcriptional regulator
LLRSEGDRRMKNIKLEHEREVAEAHAKQLELEKARVEHELDLKTQHLITLAMTIEQHSNMLKTISTELRSVSKQIPTRNKKLIEELSRKLKQESEASEAWQLFEKQLDTLNTDFIAMLAGKYPQLTPRELKHCALLKVGLESKEIANVLSIGIRTVESYRLGIRRKLKLPKTTNLTSFIAGLR